MNDMLRHTVATLAYRGGKAMRDAPAEFATYRAGPDGRTAGEILAHLCDLFDWAMTLADGKQARKIMDDHGIKCPSVHFIDERAAE